MVRMASLRKQRRSNGTVKSCPASVCQSMMTSTWGGEGEDYWHESNPGARNPTVPSPAYQQRHLRKREDFQQLFKQALLLSVLSASIGNLARRNLYFVACCRIAYSVQSEICYQCTCNTLSSQMTQVPSNFFSIPKRFQHKKFYVLACFKLSSYCRDIDSTQSISPFISGD